MKNKKIKLKYKLGILVILVILLGIAGWGIIKKSTDVNSGATKKKTSIQIENFDSNVEVTI